MASNYPPGVTGNEPEISGIHSPESVIDWCSSEADKIENIVDEILSYLDDQGAGLSAKAEADILDAVQTFKDDIENRRPPEYDPYDSSI